MTLAEEMVICKAQGYGPMYGRWVRDGKPGMPESVRPETPPKPAHICKHCGNPFNPRNGCQLYCDDQCRAEHNRPKVNELHRKYEAKKRRKKGAGTG